MKRTVSLATSAITAMMVIPGCSDLPPGQTGIFGRDGAAAGGRMAQAAAMTNAESIATGSTASLVAGAAVVVIAKHAASERQRQVAKAHAHAALARLRTHAPEGAAPLHLSKEARVQAHAAPGRDAGLKTAENEPGKRSPKRAATPRYIAVDTVKDERTAPKAAKSIVIFDTETEEIVGNNVYDVKNTPPVGGTAKFETYTAEYVGSGS